MKLLFKQAAPILALLALSAPVFAQGPPDITGNWQGTIAAGGRDIRVIFKIGKTGNALNAAFYAIDQTPQPFPVNPITLQGTNAKMTVPGLGAGFEGKLDAAGTSMTGTWAQSGATFPLVLAHATAQTAWAIPEPPAPPKPMAANANPSFEVATIKPSDPNTQGRLLSFNNRQMSTLNTSLENLIWYAYGVHVKQIVGGPSWMASESYDVTGKPDGEGEPSTDQWKKMIQKLLADRFQLQFHRDKRELSVYAITVGKNGPKLTKSTANPGGLPSLLFRGLGSLPAQNASMGEFAEVMGGAVLDRPVVDQTGLKGKFDFTLNWTPDEFQFTNMGIKVPPPSNDPKAPPDLFTAFQAQLGLKLEATKAQVEVLVIDKVAKPSEN